MDGFKDCDEYIEIFTDERFNCGEKVRVDILLPTERPNYCRICVNKIK